MRAKLLPHRTRSASAAQVRSAVAVSAAALVSAAAMIAALAPDASAAPSAVSSAAPSAAPSHPLPIAVEPLVTEGIAIEGPLVNNLTLPTLR
ncbi:hypothetical protein [Streptomyces flavalbus]|uniref:Uncharacterized protein n=1 Tax=Streptomyces flavalbus TaxID=2665155 RepID=A0ABW2W9G7_9ACTN